MIISQNQNFQLDDGYTLANSPQDALAKLSRFENVLVAGGANINSAFAKAHLLDEIILNVEPVFIGEGISLFAPQDFEMKAKLLSTKTNKSGIVTMKYEVLK